MRLTQMQKEPRDLEISTICYGIRGIRQKGQNSNELLALGKAGDIFSIKPQLHSSELFVQKIQSQTSRLSSAIIPSPFSSKLIIVVHLCQIEILKGENHMRFQRIFFQNDNPTCIHWASPKSFLVATNTGRVSLFDLQKKLKTIQVFQSKLIIYDFVIFTQDSNASKTLQIVAVGEEQSIIRVSVPSGKEIWSRKTRGPKWDYESVVLTPSKRLLVLGTDYRCKQIIIVDVGNGEIKAICSGRGFTDGIHSLFLSPSLEILVALTGMEIVTMDFIENSLEFRIKEKIFFSNSSGFVIWGQNGKHRIIVFQENDFYEMELPK